MSDKTSSAQLFSRDDRNRLIGAMREARHFVTVCKAAEPSGSELHKRCDGVAQSIDALAEALTGDRAFFHMAFGRAAPQCESELDELTAAVFNAVNASPGLDPVDTVDDLEGSEIALQEWNTIRRALERMPPDVLARLIEYRNAGAS